MRWFNFLSMVANTRVWAHSSVSGIDPSYLMKAAASRANASQKWFFDWDYGTVTWSNTIFPFVVDDANSMYVLQSQISNIIINWSINWIELAGYARRSLCKHYEWTSSNNKEDIVAKKRAVKSRIIVGKSKNGRFSYYYWSNKRNSRKEQVGCVWIKLLFSIVVSSNF